MLGSATVPLSEAENINTSLAEGVLTILHILLLAGIGISAALLRKLVDITPNMKALSPKEAENVLKNGSARDIEALGGREKLENIIVNNVKIDKLASIFKKRNDLLQHKIVIYQNIMFSPNNELIIENSGVIDILDSTDVNVKKIKSAVTDTGKEIKFDEKNKPGVSNLLTIYTALSGKTIADAENEFVGKGYGEFKGAVAEATVEYLRPMREKALELLKDEGELTRILNNGADKARVLASKTLKDSYKALGILG